MPNEEQYYEKYLNMILFVRTLHKNNERRIRIGLNCIFIIPAFFLVLLFVTNSSKVVFMFLWILSLLVLSAFLIVVEYSDYRMMRMLKELLDVDDDAWPDTTLLTDERQDAQLKLQELKMELAMRFRPKEQPEEEAETAAPEAPAPAGADVPAETAPPAAEPQADTAPENETPPAPPEPPADDGQDKA